MRQRQYIKASKRARTLGFRAQRSEGMRARKIGFEPLVLVLFFLFSLLLMFHTFGYDGKTKSILVASKLWSDFGSHIPLIRSFSMGANYPPEYPLFPGEPIRYHFLFYALVGMLEKIGLRLDLALNLPSAIGFALLLFGIYKLSSYLFQNHSVSVLSVIFFLFNGSLAFITFFTREPQNLRDFPAFGPWDGGLITAFWNLNIYTNQRHLAWAFALGIWFLVWIARGRPRLLDAIVWGILMGILPYFHQPMLLVFAVLLLWYFLVFPSLRWPLIIMGLIAALVILPQLGETPIFPPGGGSSLLESEDGKNGSSPFRWYLGYLIHDRLSVVNVVSFWFQNLGLHTILIPLGFFLIPNRAKKLLIPLFLLFLIGNLFKFSPEVAANHKFFNFALILGNIITAYAIVRLFASIIFIKFITVIIIIALTLSGIIDLAVIAGDTKGALADVGNDKAATWIAANTPREAIFLNSSFLYHPASLAGRKAFLGWPYFAWSAGYDTYKRNDDMKTMYESKDPTLFCPLLNRYNISYITVEDTKGDPNLPKIDPAYFRSLASPAFMDETISLAIYTTRALCGR